MSIFKVGEIDIGDQTLQNEYLTEFILHYIALILEKNNKKIIAPTSEEIATIREKVVKKIQGKYPKSGITLNT